jgi:Uma2 family endonuclease
MVATEPKYWTYEDLCGLPDDGRTRYEIIDGELYEMPAPEPDHAFTIANLMFWLSPIVRMLGGRIAPAPIDLFFAGANPVQPDIVVLLAERLHQVSKRGIEGAPNLVIEILSPSNAGRDRRKKRTLYARGGVPEYWLVDPRARAIEVLVLDGGTYRLHLRASGNDLVTSTVLPGLSFLANEAFA